MKKKEFCSKLEEKWKKKLIQNVDLDFEFQKLGFGLNFPKKSKCKKKSKTIPILYLPLMKDIKYKLFCYYISVITLSPNSIFLSGLFAICCPVLQDKILNRRSVLSYPVLSYPVLSRSRTADRTEIRIDLSVLFSSNWNLSKKFSYFWKKTILWFYSN